MKWLVVFLLVLPIYLPIVSQCSDPFYFMGATKCPVVADVPLQTTQSP